MDAIRKRGLFVGSIILPMKLGVEASHRLMAARGSMDGGGTRRVTGTSYVLCRVFAGGGDRIVSGRVSIGRGGSNCEIAASCVFGRGVTSRISFSIAR